MIRVIYHWRVNPSDFSEFRNVWKNTTNRIHESVPGALGSFMLRARGNEHELITMARWDSYESWRKFWGDRKPREMEVMQNLGERLSVEVYEEIDDFTR